MHELLRERLHAEAVPPVLAQFPLDGGALIAAFAPRGDRRLRWLAKTAYGAAACRRLDAEARALGLLAPLAEELELPRLLAFRQTGADEAASACLVQTAITGRRIRCRWSGSPQAAFPRPMLVAQRWLERFQERSRSLPLSCPTLAEIGTDTAARAAQILHAEPALAPLLAWVPQFFAAPGPSLRAVAIHGDFWPGNVLWNASSSSVGVIDWSGFGTGSALDDLLTWMTQMPAGRPQRPLSRVQYWPALLFQPGHAQRCLLAWSRRAGYDAATARYALYLFLARRLLWELGFGLQARGPAEREGARRAWSAVLIWLAERQFPAFETPPPVPCA